MRDIHADRLLILDFGSQYTQLIARRIRELGVYCEIYPWDVDYAHIVAFAGKGLILSGGPESVNDANPPKLDPRAFALGVPILGICYGMQTMAAQLGGRVQSGAHREFGYAKVSAVGDAPLLAKLEVEPAADPLLQNEARENEFGVWMSHGDRVDALPEGFRVTAHTESVPIVAMANESKRFYGLQFHPEVTHTPQGLEILRRFCIDVCACQALWTPEHIISDALNKLRAQIGSDPVLLGLSGGVDSSVVAALLDRAVGTQLTCVFVDTGLLRWQEGDEVMALFADQRHLKVVRVDAKTRFFDALSGLSDPEAKRKAIGRVFVEVFEAEAEKFKLSHGSSAKWLAQGTIYPDVIESAASKTGKAHVIKSHHNVGGLPEHMQMGLVEPLRELFKDEVRRVGLALGLPAKMIHRHPFPGPGLAVRMLGEIKPDCVEILQRADAIFIEALHQHDLYHKVSQAFAVFLPIKSVGVVGDARAYEWVIALRAVETVDFMTAHWARLPYDFLDLVARRIVNEVRGISRVVYDISGKPPATIEWE